MKSLKDLIKENQKKAFIKIFEDDEDLNLTKTTPLIITEEENVTPVKEETTPIITEEIITEEEEFSSLVETIIQGLDGRDGLDGQDGQDGIDGKNGIDGNDGKDGIDGRDGRDGVDGIIGRDGEDGVDGRDGREIELKAEKRAIYWKYVDDIEWDLLLDLSKKSDKDRMKDILDKVGVDDVKSDTTYPMPTYPMTPGISIGAPGPGVEIRINDELMIQWRVKSPNCGWIDLIGVDDINDKIVTATQTINEVITPMVIIDNDGNVVSAY